MGSLCTRIVRAFGPLVFTLTLTFGSTVVMQLAVAEPAAACHGNGVSRSCNIPGGVRVESVSYDPFWSVPWYQMIYTQSWYYYNWQFALYGDHTCYSDWSCDHGLYVTGDASNYQVYGGHTFRHNDANYYIGQSFTNGQCNPSEVGGC